MGGSLANAFIGHIDYGQAMQQAQQNQYQLYGGGASSVAYIPPTKPETKKETNMITEVAKDAKAFIKEHKSAIYWTVMLLIIDHFFFHGAFKEKLKATMQKLVGKVESKVASIEP